MEQPSLNFFDDQYFSEACLCDMNKSDSCPIHKVIVEEQKQKKTIPVFNEQYFTDLYQVKSQKKTTQPVKLVEINQSFPKQPSNELTPFIEYRVKLFACEEIIFFPGECKTLQTNTSITRKYGSLSLLIKTVENSPLNCQNEGFINPSFRGNVTLQFGNAKYEHVVIVAGSLVGYLILTPFIE